MQRVSFDLWRRSRAARAVTPRVILVAAVVGGVYAAVARPASTHASSPLDIPSSITGLHVQGNQILNGAGQPVIFHGVDRSGTEYSCVGGTNVEDGPMDAPSVQAIASWHTNIVRIPLNEDCWLGINGVVTGGATYQQAIVNYVNLLNQYGLAAILDLHMSAPGSVQATGQEPMADQDHTPAFWTSVANTFKGNSSVLFDLYNEPFPDNSSNGTTAWQCLLNGCTVTAGQGMQYQAAGMQELVNTVRATGATNVIMIGGVNYASYIDQWLTYEPTDPDHNLVASWHAYNHSACSNQSCWTSTVAPVAQQVPIIVGESSDTDCTYDYGSVLDPWLDSMHISYLSWTWDTWNSCEALITNYDGTAKAPYGQDYQAHLASIASQPTPTPVNTDTPVPQPTNTNTPVPQPTSTNTPRPQPTNTSTPRPQPTNTNTPQPQPTNTPTTQASSTPVPPTPTQPGPTPVPGSFRAALNNAGVSDDSAPSAANFDGVGYSYSAQALQAAGLAPGKVLTIQGTEFRWPPYVGVPDNVVAQGQTITFRYPRHHLLAFLGAADHGPSIGTATLTYSDGTTQQFQLGFSDWTLNAGKSVPSYGNVTALVSAYRNSASGQQDPIATEMFFASVPVAAGKVAVSVTLPSSVNQGRLHILALGGS